jgi:hypothetical protein
VHPDVERILETLKNDVKANPLGTPIEVASSMYQNISDYLTCGSEINVTNVPVPSMDVYIKPEEGKHLPTNASDRKKIPLYSGVLKYFPDALVAVAKVSQAGNDQHNPGQPLHWSREKSKDHEDTLMRHLLEVGTVDIDGHRHAAKLAWRALAILQLEIEKERNATAKG